MNCNTSEKTISAETRKRMSDSAKARCTEIWRKSKSIAMETPLDTDVIRRMYQSGMTQAEIAKELNVTQKIIWRHMKNHGIQARIAYKRNQAGALNSSWKGGGASYTAFHQRVYKAYGKASEYGCSVCGRHDDGIIYDWANLTGNYDDVKDYCPMCRSCHRKYDKEREKVT